MKYILSGFFFTCLALGCNQQAPTAKSAPKAPQTQNSQDSTKTTIAPKPAAPAEIMARKQVPVLCYHHIVPHKATNMYQVMEDKFKAQLQILADSGYHTILPEQLYAYLNFGTPLPAKPVVISFDDTHIEQFTIAKKELEKHGFKGAFYIMTISIGRPNYMSREQIKQLADDGHSVGSHTWDHSRFDKYQSETIKEIGGRKKLVNDYDLQLANTRKQLEEITGKPVEHFAYPFGVWNAAGIPELQQRGYKSAFQLAAKRDSLQPLYTIRRILVLPQWSAQQMLKTMNSSF
jgi:peptidoglycan/xylan/chitin deacetylase (PgdA/CDA1 family)